VSERFADFLRDFIRAEMGLAPRHLVEIAGVLVGARSMARIVLAVEHHGRLSSLLAAAGLRGGSPSVVNRVVRTCGDDRYCERVARSACFEPTELISVIVALDSDLAEKGQRVDDLGDSSECGAMLGYPECCIKAYARIERGEDWVELLERESLPASLSLHWSCNSLAGLFTASTLHPDFFPCTIGCPHAASLVRELVRAGASCGLHEELAAGIDDMRKPCLLMNGVVVGLDGPGPESRVIGCEVRPGRDRRWAGVLTHPEVRVVRLPGGVRVLHDGREVLSVKARSVDFSAEIDA
jgi:hypothetical protein